MRLIRPYWRATHQQPSTGRVIAHLGAQISLSCLLAAGGVVATCLLPINGPTLAQKN